MPAEFEVAEERLEQLLARYPMLNAKYKEGVESFCDALEAACFADDFDLDNFRVTDFVSDTRWNIGSDKSAEITKQKQALYHKYSKISPKEKSEIAARLRILGTASNNKQFNAFLNADPDIKFNINSRPKLLENYFRSYYASLPEEVVDCVDDIGSLQFAVDLDSDYVAVMQVHAFLTNWGADYPKDDTVEEELVQSGPEPIPMFDGLDAPEIHTVSMEAPQLDDITPVFKDYEDLSSKHGPEAAMGLFSMLSAFGNNKEEDFDDDDDNDVVLEQDDSYNESDFDSEEIVSDDEDTQDTAESYDEDDFEDEEVIEDDSDDSDFNDLPDEEDISDFDEEFYEDELEENDLKRFTLLDVTDLGIHKPKVATPFSDDYDMYDSEDMDEDDDEEDDDFEDDYIDSDEAEEYDEDDFDDEEIIDEDVSEEEYDESDDTDDEIYEGEDATEETYDESDDSDEEEIIDESDSEISEDDDFDDDAFEEAYSDDSEASDEEYSDDDFDDEAFEEAYSDTDDSEEYDEESYDDTDEEEQYDEDSEEYAEDSEEYDEESYNDTDEEEQYDEGSEEYDEDSEDSEDYEEDYTDSEESYDEDDSDEDFEDNFVDIDESEEQEEFDEFDSEDYSEDEESYEDSSDDNEDYSEDDFEDPDAGLEDEDDEFGWDNDDLASTLEPDEYDDGELGYGEFNELAAQEGIDVFADPADMYDSSNATAPGTEDFGLTPTADIKKTPVTKEEKNKYYADNVVLLVDKMRNAPKLASRVLKKIFFKEGD